MSVEKGVVGKVTLKGNGDNIEKNRNEGENNENCARRNGFLSQAKRKGMTKWGREWCYRTKRKKEDRNIIVSRKTTTDAVGRGGWIMFGLAPSSLDVGGRGKTFPATTASHSLNPFIFPRERLRSRAGEVVDCNEGQVQPRNISRRDKCFYFENRCVIGWIFKDRWYVSFFFAPFFLLEHPRALERAQLDCELMRTPTDVCVTHTHKHIFVLMTRCAYRHGCHD